MEARVIKREDLLSVKANSSVMENAGFQGYKYQRREFALTYLEVEIYLGTIIGGGWRGRGGVVRPDESVSLASA